MTDKTTLIKKTQFTIDYVVKTIKKNQILIDNFRDDNFFDESDIIDIIIDLKATLQTQANRLQEIIDSRYDD